MRVCPSCTTASKACWSKYPITCLNTVMFSLWVVLVWIYGQLWTNTHNILCFLWFLFCNNLFIYLYFQSVILDDVGKHSNSQPEPVFTQRQRPDPNVSCPLRMCCDILILCTLIFLYSSTGTTCPVFSMAFSDLLISCFCKHCNYCTLNM